LIIHFVLHESKAITTNPKDGGNQSGQP
jgi:hypothetical protein